MITILSSLDIGQAIKHALQEKNISSNYLDIRQYQVDPCYSCNGCLYKTYKKCICKDDTNTIMKEIINSNTLIIVDDIRFGSYSFKMKRIIDKFTLGGDGFYQVTGKELTKRLDGNLRNVYVVGLQEAKNKEEQEVFSNLVKETLILTNWHGDVMTGDYAILPIEILERFLL